MRLLVSFLTLIICLSQTVAVLRGAEADKKTARPNRNETGDWLKRFGRVPIAEENERSHESVRKAFREVVASASRATVRVLADDLQTSLGVVVHPEGYILTKASELDGRLECLLPDGRRFSAVRCAQREELDLALLRIQAVDLPVVQWSDESVPLVGSWLATPNIDGEPTAIGVVSVEPRPIPVPIPALGVRLDQGDQGVRIARVYGGSGAARAGIRAGDIIVRADGRPTQSPESLTGLIREHKPGDKITLSINRETESLSIVATLGDLARLGDQEQAELMDSLGGPLSRRRAGFSSVLQHDSVLRPRDCGGPVVDLDGKAIGVNIARASRVATYALPASVVRPIIKEMLQQGLASRPSELKHPVSTNP